MTSRFKSGVSIRGISPEMLFGWIVVVEVLAAAGYDCIVTSGNDSRHARGSRHYIGHALDFRSKHVLTLAEKRTIELEVQNRLAPLNDFDFFLEDVGTDNEHYHLQYKPKERR
jgi:hypothetical protein